jgi:hypothetical protein
MCLLTTTDTALAALVKGPNWPVDISSPSYNHLKVREKCMMSIKDVWRITEY